jgi:4-oxalocrotonate tautomerase family enzyme
MPLVELSVTEGALSSERKVKMANEICDLLVEAIPGLPREAVSVIFYENPEENWMVGGVTVKELIKRMREP